MEFISLGLTKNYVSARSILCKTVCNNKACQNCPPEAPKAPAAAAARLFTASMREGARLIASETAKGDCDSLTAETTMTLGQFKAAVGWAYAQVAQVQAKPN